MDDKQRLQAIKSLLFQPGDEAWLMDLCERLQKEVAMARMLKPYCGECGAIVPTRTLEIDGFLKHWCEICAAPVTTFVKDYKDDPVRPNISTITRTSGFNLYRGTVNQRHRFSR